jgi:hypothetical protein
VYGSLVKMLLVNLFCNFDYVHLIRNTKLLKGQSNEIFCLRYLWNGLPPNRSLGIWKLFEFKMEFVEIFAIFDWPPILLIVEIQYSWYSLYCLIRRFATSRIFCGRELQMYWLCAETLGCWLIWRVKIPASFVAGSHCWQRGVILKNAVRLPLPLMGYWSRESAVHEEHCPPGKCQKYGLRKAQYLTPFYHWQRGVNFSIFWIRITPRILGKKSKLLLGMSIGTRVVI